MILNAMNIKEELYTRFLRYAGIPGQSDSEKAAEGCLPSSEGQRTLALLLADELRELGLSDVVTDEHAIVTGHLPSDLPAGETAPAVGWCCHLDTVDVKLSPVIRPVLVKNYPGGDICQNQEKGIYIKADDHPELAGYVGQDILCSDGTSVLGADDRAAIANVMTALACLKENPDLRHGDIYIAFVPDEEIGLLGAKALDLSRFPVDYAYTIDCCGIGELVYETFNAGSGTLRITGVTAHPMSSKNRVVNPALIAVDFIGLLDRGETPEHTEGREGFIWVTGITADTLHAEVSLCIRDHSLTGYRQKKDYLTAACEMIRRKHPKAQISLSLTDTYGNIADAVTEENRGCIDALFTGMRELGIDPKPIPMRGGTDGSYLSVKGIPTPNYFTGAHNFHAVSEFLPMDSFESSCLLTLKLMELAAGKRSEPI